jgi:hypothetical protein
VRGFLYTGPSVTQGQVTGHRSVALPFAPELARSASVLASGSTPTYVAAAPSDLDARPEREGTEASFQQAFAGFPQAPLMAEDGAGGGCVQSVGCQASYYAFSSGGVRVIVMDDSSAEVSEAQMGWLEGELAAAKASGEPAIAVGSADLAAQAAAGNRQAAAVARVLATGSRSGACVPSCDSASAYFYDSPEENVAKPLRAGAEQIPSFGSGTLGYVNVKAEQHGNFHGASGMLLAQVQLTELSPAARLIRSSTNRAPVSTRLIPVIGELAMEAKQGTLLRRSQPALFSGLARRPRAGCRAGATGNSSPCEVDPYIPIPSICVGECATALLPEYSFTSSRPDIGNFVAPNTAAADALSVLQGTTGEPIPDAQSGLFCAYNPGTTIVTISAGGLAASLPVTVQAGSVRQPCGTVPLKELPTSQQQPVPAPPPSQPAPSTAAPASSLPPAVPLPPPPPLPAPLAVRPPAVLPPFIPPVALPAALLPFVPPPVPTPARPTPPSGTSAVTSPIEVAEKEEEEEEATESVSNQAVAYRTSEHEPAPVYLLGLLVLAAFAGASVRRRPRRGRREVRVAPATVSGARSQRRMSREPRRPR